MSTGVSVQPPGAEARPEMTHARHHDPRHGEVDLRPRTIQDDHLVAAVGDDAHAMLDGVLEAVEPRPAVAARRHGAVGPAVRVGLQGIVLHPAQDGDIVVTGVALGGHGVQAQHLVDLRQVPG